MLTDHAKERRFGLPIALRSLPHLPEFFLLGTRHVVSHARIFTRLVTQEVQLREHRRLRLGELDAGFLHTCEREAEVILHSPDSS